MATGIVKLAQVFNIYGAFTPTKASVYIRPVGTVGSYFDISENNTTTSIWGAVIDAPNFATMTPPTVSDLVSVYKEYGLNGTNTSGSGAMFVFDPDGGLNINNDGPRYSYPIKCDAVYTGSYTIYVRASTEVGAIDIGVYLDGAYQTIILDHAVADTDWHWYTITIAISSSTEQVLGLDVRNPGAGIDKIYIAPTALATIPSGEGHALTASPYVTLHYGLQHVKTNGDPDTTYIDYLYDDYKTTLNYIMGEDWYNFDIDFVDPSYVVEFADRQAFTLVASGSSSDHFVVWDLNEPDVYICGVSSFKTTDVSTVYDMSSPVQNVGYYYMYNGLANIVSDQWYSRNDKNFLLKVYSDRDSVDPYGAYIYTTAPAETSMEVNSFTGNTTDMVNTEIVNDTVGGEDIALELEDKTLGLVLDVSGSMSWNDNADERYDVAERFIRRVSSTYPGSVDYAMFKFGGQEFDIVLAAGSEEDIDSPDLICSADAYGDSNSRFYGVRVVRNLYQYPANPIDGEIVFDGISNYAFDTDITSGETYYYKVYTFDNHGHFSDGVNFVVSPNGSSVPIGLSSATSYALKGSGVQHDDSVVASWHLDEKNQIEYNSRQVYDFEGNFDLLISDTVPQWLNQSDVPSGSSGLRFDGVSTSVSTVETISGCVFNRPFSVMCWIKPLSFDGQKPLIARQSNATSGWIFATENVTGNLLFIDSGVTIGTSTIPVVTEEWSHVAVAVDADGLGKFYLNGIQCGTFTAASSNPQSLMFVDIGYDRLASQYFWGEMTEFSIHSTARDQSYINNYASVSTQTDRDNGDRLVVLTGVVTADQNYDTVRILYKQFSASYNEEDGDIVYEEAANDGDFYATYRDDFLLNTTCYFRVFTENSAGNFSNIYDSLNLPVQIPGVSDEASESLPSLALPTPVVSSTFEGANTIYIDINNTDVIINDNVESIKIYFSNDDYPLVDNYDNTGELVKEDSKDLSEFVHSQLDSDKTYYYSIVYSDRYGRTSTAANIEAKPNSSDSMAAFPTIDVDGVSYEIISGSSIKIFWDNPLTRRNLETYFDEEVALYAKLIDNDGNIITNTDNVDVSLSVASSYTFSDDAAPDIFNGETSLPDIDATTLYSYAIESFNDGETRGRIYLNQNGTLFNSLDIVNLIVTLNVIIKNPENADENIYEYRSEPVNIRFVNPLSLEFDNLNKTQVTSRCAHSLSSLDKQITYETKLYDGSYVGASNPYISRVYALYKNHHIVGGSISTSVNSVLGDLCDQSTLVDSGISNAVDSNGPLYNLVVAEDDIQDTSGGFTGGTRIVSYADVSLAIPDTNKNVYLYAKIFFKGFSIVKKTLVVFASPLKIDPILRVPSANGTDEAEQFASVYVVDPDDPENMSLASPVDNIWLTWTLVPKTAGETKALTYTGTPPNEQMPNDGLLSYVSNGMSNEVFIGPVINVQFIGYDDLDRPLYETHTLTVSANYDDYVASQSYELEFVPFAYDGTASAGSYMLMEFGAYKSDLYTDGRNYEKMIISHDPSTSITKYSDTFRSCLSASGKDLVELFPGQGILINTSDPDMEIIWGDVYEYVDPYVGDWVLDTTDAHIGYGSEFIRLSDGDQTEVFFRKNTKTVNWAIGFESSSDSLCADYLGVVSIPEYKEEVIVDASTMAIYNNSEGNISIPLVGGGSLDKGFIPTVLVPTEPLLIKAVDKTANGVSIDSFIVDGETVNKIVLQVSFAGHVVPEGTLVSLNVVNSTDEVVTVESSTVETSNYVISSLSPDTKSYATIALLPITRGISFDAKIFSTVSFDQSGDVSRSATLCVRLAGDAEDYLTDPTANTVRSLFSKTAEYANLATLPTLTWQSTPDMNSERAYTGTMATTGTHIYMVGGVNGSRILGTVDDYDSFANTWTTKNSMQYPRMMTTSIITGGYIYVFGGISYDPSGDGRLYVSRKVERYHVVNNVWEELEDMPNISLGGPDPVSYGVAGGMCYFGQQGASAYKIYILSGIREITADGLAVEYNDRILEYNFNNDTWSYSDVVSEDEIENYKRAFPVFFYYSPIQYLVSGGSRYEDGELKYITDTYLYNSDTGEISQADDRFGALPDFRDRSGYVRRTVSSFFAVGGSNGEKDYLDTCEYFSLSGSVFQKQRCTDLVYAKSGAHTSVGLDGGFNENLYVMGGMVSGKGNNFLEIFTETYNSNLHLSRNQGLDIKINLKDSNNNDPSGNVTAKVRGYLQIASAQEGYEYILPKVLADNKVLFDSSTVTINNGEGYVRLIPRSDDYISNIMSFVSFDDNLKYKIIIQITIEDATYYGSTNVYWSDLLVQDEIPDVRCIPSSSNLLVESMQYNVNIDGFDLLGNKLWQQPVGVVNCYNDRPWIPFIENLTPDGAVNATNAIDILDNLREEDPFGGSPLYDALVFSSQVLSGSSYWDKSKKFYVFTDKEPNSSYYSIKQAGIDVNGIDNYQDVPIVLVNMAFGADAILPTLYRRTDYPDFNTLTNDTGGQGFTISDSSVVDDLVLMLSGDAKGSLGYGEAVYVLDFGSLVNLRSAIVNYQLYANTNGRWKIAISEDGYNYDVQTPYFAPNYLADFSDASCRYVKFIMELYSGLSASNEEEYEDIPTAGIPRITDIDVVYAVPKEDYIYTNPITADIDQLVIVTDSNVLHTDNKNILGGTTTGDYSHNWDDYSRDAQPAVEKNGRVVIPLRNGTTEEQRIEPLESIDGHAFMARNGSWGPWATVQIYAVSGSTITLASASSYTLYPRDGLVVFKENRASLGLQYINIFNASSFKTGIKIVNDDTTDVRIYGIANMYNEYP